MSVHPLIERAKQREVRQAKGFREAAASLGGEALLADYRQGIARAPRRSAAGKKYLVRRSRPRRTRKDADRLAAALARSTGPEAPLALPDGTTLELLAHHVPLASGPVDRAKPDDPNADAGRIDLLGLTSSARLAVIALAYVPPDATRVGTGDTPLRALLEGLGRCAMVQADLEGLAGELRERLGREVSEEPPLLVLLGSPRYWELCRRREAQKGAAWIQQMERLAKEVGESIGVPVLYLTARFEGDPPWREDEEGWPVLLAPPRLLPAWDEFAGRVRPKPKPRPRAKVAPSETVVEADLSRPVRTYAMNDSYEPGDRVAHPQFGTGVVQGVLGPRKIKVRFDGQQRVLVHQWTAGPA